ncbi:Hpt domain-containing protein [Marinomonas mediterranea]|jgi:Hpt domain.|uniref:Hpt domain protein n=1 Tax=Marinomonas mediterranea (strain ATCC 700492 / JCM 21426 / NBRC 103028 / MMB-1) TaxID=717774 RepID=F2K105_MARM1|nr:Hpt domain-containing protein [Marinomonas mediterranea]ADZ93354.1 Hpt domain protein [Marinomonas mediterranea MMB-1]WCN11244.1 hypothetical protein GV055_21065 [Marinomonas mediterranea]WCN19351.1 hypothetical protein GV053_21045 [Marinomonas mediterranea MMB-1]
MSDQTTNKPDSSLIDSTHLTALLQIIGADALNAIKETYIRDVQDKLPELLKHATTDNFTLINELSHSLKSASANMGLTILSKRYAYIEHASENKQHERLLEEVRSLQTLQDNSLTALEDLFSEFKS